MSKNFSIKETVNKNIEKNQFPSFSNYRSMVGWCSMNYPKNLVNPIYMDKQTNVPDQKKYELNSLFQKKNPTERQKVQFTKPLSKLRSPSQEKPEEQQKLALNPDSIKISSQTLTSTSHKMRSQIFEENNKISEEYSAVLPIKNYLGTDYDGNYDRKIRQIGEVTYTPHFQNEEMRHLKKMPKTVIDEQNLISILNADLEYLSLEYKAQISNDLIDKIGYLAPNIKSLNLTALNITNKVLVELGKSCKQLQQIDISKCYQLEEFAIITFLKDCVNLNKFAANHLAEAITDSTLECFTDKKITSLQINFCSAVTPTGFQFLSGKPFERLYLSSLPHIKNDNFSQLITDSTETLKEIDLSFNTISQVNNALMGKLGLCLNLQTIILTGCEKVNDEGINNLMNGEKGKVKENEGFVNLRVLKLGGLINISDKLHTVFKKCPNLGFLEANNLERLGDNFLEQLKTLPGKKIILINFTPNITDEKIKEISAINKDLKIIRTISKMTDPNDDGLRMPIPPASLKIKKPKKKKK